MSALLFGVYAIASNILILEKKTKITGSIWIIIAILNLSLNIILVPYFGILGAAAITLIAYALGFILTFYYSNKFFNFDFDLIFVIKSVIASILMSCIIILINPYGLLNIIITVIICSALYLVLITILKGINKEEFKLVKELF